MPFNMGSFYNECMGISSTKKKGYTGDKAACFNFVMTELLLNTPAWKTVTVRLLDKACRRVSFTTTGSEVPDDSFTDCAKDTANYSAIQHWLYEHRDTITKACQDFKQTLLDLEAPPVG